MSVFAFAPARFLGAASFLAILAGTAHAQSADEALAAAVAEKGNWMYDYVLLRTAAMSDRAIPDDLEFPSVPEIVGGEAAQPGDHAFQVALLNKPVADDFDAQFCGGTLIAPDVVVTAAHCSDFVTAGAVQVLTGSQRLDGSGTRHDVASIAIHPNWNSATFDFDVAVWRLADPAGKVPVAALADDDGATGDDLLVTGWGALQENGAFPVDLQKVEVPLVDRDNCNDANSYNGSITDRMLCAGFDFGGRDSCQGDSGGPLTKGGDDGPLTGIVSFGRGCARPNLFGVYTRVSNPEVRSFIDANAN